MLASLIAAAILVCFSTGKLNGDVAPTSAPSTQPAITPIVSSKVTDLINQLGSDSAEDRDSAQKQLVNLGPPVIPALKKAADKSDDPEIRSRAAAAMAQMKDQDSNGVSLITLHMKNAPDADVLNSIGAQAHTQFVGFSRSAAPGQAGPTLTIDADQKPFWEVMTDVCAQMNVCPRIDTQVKNTIQFLPTQRNWMTQSQHQIVGPYWINVAGLYRARSIDMLGVPRTDDQFSIRLMVLPEPKLAVTQMSELIIKEAKDDAGNSLLPAPEAAAVNSILRNARTLNHTVEARLSYPENPGKKITLLRGEITVMLAQDVQQYQMDDVLGTPKITNPITGCKIQANVMRQGTDMFRVTIQCDRQALSEDQWNTMLNRLNDLSLEDADGKALTGYPTSMQVVSGTTESGFTSTTLFNRNTFTGIAAIGIGRQITKTGEPKRLTWNVATSVKPVVIPVEFKDLPMP